MIQFYRQEFKKVLDTQIVQFGIYLAQCLQAVKPVATVLKPPLQQPNLENVNEVVKLFP